MASNASRLKEALAGGQAKEKGPVVADGVLSITPDPPEASWSKSVLESLSADSSFLEDDGGKQPNQLFGKFTWKIENFSDISNHGSKRELRSNQFNVGEYKWYILVYPQGCDVCNHLSLFLCVADYDKLLPGWSHFAQFTIAVVNKDPKKSKYSDTLHRFCKKEHDWGWKKFMELNKVLDGFTVADTLVIKAQVQVILDRPSRPFRCLDSQYRRELVRVYLTNVESICRRFCEEKRQRLAWLRDDAGRFKSWWRGLSSERQQHLSREKGEAILKGIVKQFFNEKEVTSTLVMDALFCGCKQLEKLGRNKSCLLEGFSAPTVVITGRNCTFSFAMDALDIAKQLNADFIPVSRDDKAVSLGADGLGLRSGCDELSELRRDALERDEKRLAELGRKTVEMYALAHIFTEQLERAYRDFESEQRMKDLIAEEEEAGRLQDERAAARAAAEKEKKAKKKERMRAKKEAERAKREAEAAERIRQQEEKRAEQDKKAAEASQRQKQDGAAVLLRHAQPTASVSNKQQQEAAANGDLADHSSCSISRHLDVQQQMSSSITAIRGPPAAAEASSRPDNAGAGPSSSAYGKFSNSSSPLAGSAAPSIEAASSVDSDTQSVDSSSSEGFAPVRRRHQHPQHLPQLQQHARPGSASSSGTRRRGLTSSQQPHQLQQQQQQQQQPAISSSGSGIVTGPSGIGMPTGYAAAVAGMRPPPPAEVTAAAVAMAEQQRRIKDLEDQVSVLTKQVQEWQQMVSERDAVIARKEQETAEVRSQLAQQQQQMQQLEKQAADWRTAAATTSKDVANTLDSKLSNSSSIRLSDDAVTSARWAAVAAAGVSSASGSSDVAVADQQRPLVSPPGSVGEPVASEQQYPGSSHVGAAAAADKQPAASATRTASYAETVSGMVNQHHLPSQPQQQQQQQQSVTRPLSAGSLSAGSSRHNSSNLSSHSRGRSAADVAEPSSERSAADHVTAVSSSNGPLGSPTGAASSGRASSTADEGLSEVDVPVSPATMVRSGSAAGAGVAPGPAGATGNADDRPAASGSDTAAATHSSSGYEGSRGHEAAAAAAAAAGLKSDGRIGAVRTSSAGTSGRCSSSGDGLPGLSLKGPGGYLSNGIAGVLHTTATRTGNSPLTPSYRSAALQQPACSNGSSDAAAAAAAVSAVPGMGSSAGSKNKANALGSSGRDPFGAFGGDLTETRGMPFGAMPASSKAPGGMQRASQTSLLDDAGLDGFVHMNMIDDLLTE